MSTEAAAGATDGNLSNAAAGETRAGEVPAGVRLLSGGQGQASFQVR